MHSHMSILVSKNNKIWTISLKQTLKKVCSKNVLRHMEVGSIVVVNIKCHPLDNNNFCHVMLCFCKTIETKWRKKYMSFQYFTRKWKKFHKSLILWALIPLEDQMECLLFATNMHQNLSPHNGVLSKGFHLICWIQWQKKIKKENCRVGTQVNLCKRQRWYHCPTEILVTDQILILNPIHASVILRISEFTEFCSI